MSSRLTMWSVECKLCGEARWGRRPMFPPDDQRAWGWPYRVCAGCDQMPTEVPGWPFKEAA